MGGPASQNELASRRNKNRFQASNVLQGFILRVGEITQSLEIAAMTIGSAYAKAGRLHKEALANRDKAIQLDTQIIFSVLTVVSSGALSWISSFAQANLAAQQATAAAKAVPNSLPKQLPLPGIPSAPGTATTVARSSKLSVLMSSFAEKELLTNTLEDAM